MSATRPGGYPEPPRMERTTRLPGDTHPLLEARERAVEMSPPASATGAYRVRWAFPGEPARTETFRSRDRAEWKFHAIRQQARALGLDALRLEELDLDGTWQERSRGAPMAARRP